MPYFTKTQRLKTRFICCNTAWIHFLLLLAILINKGILLHYQHFTKLSFSWAWNPMVYHPWVARNISCMTLCMLFFWFDLVIICCNTLERSETNLDPFLYVFFLLWPVDHMVYRPWVVRHTSCPFLALLFFCCDLGFIWCTTLEWFGTCRTWRIPFRISLSPESCWDLWN